MRRSFSFAPVPFANFLARFHPVSVAPRKPSFLSAKASFAADCTAGGTGSNGALRPRLRLVLVRRLVFLCVPAIVLDIVTEFVSFLFASPFTLNHVNNKTLCQ